MRPFEWSTLSGKDPSPFTAPHSFAIGQLTCFKSRCPFSSFMKTLSVSTSSFVWSIGHLPIPPLLNLTSSWVLAHIPSLRKPSMLPWLSLLWSFMSYFTPHFLSCFSQYLLPTKLFQICPAYLSFFYLNLSLCRVHSTLMILLPIQTKHLASSQHSHLQCPTINPVFFWFTFSFHYKFEGNVDYLHCSF